MSLPQLDERQFLLVMSLHHKKVVMRIPDARFSVQGGRRMRFNFVVAYPGVDPRKLGVKDSKYNFVEAQNRATSRAALPEAQLLALPGAVPRKHRGLHFKLHAEVCLQFT